MLQCHRKFSNDITPMWKFDFTLVDHTWGRGGGGSICFKCTILCVENLIRAHNQGGSTHFNF